MDELKKTVEKKPEMFTTPIKEIVTIDGMRIILEDGFAMIRQSNTEPVFTLRFEAKSQQNCEMYQDAMVKALDRLVKKYSE